MPNTHSTLTSLFGDIADAIRGKDGSAAPIVANDFPAKISAIPGGGGSIANGIVYDVMSQNGIPQDATIYGKILMPYSFYWTSLVSDLQTITINDVVSDSPATILADNMPDLEAIYFKKTPAFLSASTFACTKREFTIYVPWSQGDVGGAPWGATKATVVYDYAGV